MNDRQEPQHHGEDEAATKNFATNPPDLHAYEPEVDQHASQPRNPYEALNSHHGWAASTSSFAQPAPQQAPQPEQNQPVHNQPEHNQWAQQVSSTNPGQFAQPGLPSSGAPMDPFAPQQPVRKEKRKVGLGTALALMLVGSIGTGVLTAATLGGGKHVTHDYSALTEKSVSRPEGVAPGSVEDVAHRVLPSVVSIQVATRKGAGEGSGSIISSDGKVLTNHHVVGDAKNGGVIDVTLNDGSVRPADFIASDASTDIAVIQIRDVQNLPVLNFGDSSQVAVGQEVVAIGSPLGLSATVTSGIVSALNRPVRASGGGGGESSLIDAIQTDAAINPGNSGGPLVDMQGNLVGMNSVIASLSSGGSQQSGSIGLGFAIPANQAKRIAQQLIETGQVEQPVIGVKVSQNSDYRGALVAGVDPGSAADKAGITKGDLVTKVNDRVIDNADALIAAVRSQEFGSTVKLEVTKPDSKEKRTVDVKLPEAKK
ncbi:trypsin-like peptidase domain-containing protein [Staphylococcus chromogenes]|nr:trypsin-like peptidase domain-containing protein [Staphylococcus chromogenes]